MSTEIVRAEIARFLRSPLPEVLCISGQWGVGKTFAWQKFLREAEAAGDLAVSRYAYVSLFGLNTLAELRASVVENTIVAKGPLTSPDAATLHEVLRRGERFVRQSRPMLDVAAGFFRMKDAGDALYRAAFLTVRDQLVCFDDLERAGKALEIKDVLGLASMLREQRGCKVVLLLNKEKAEGEQGKQFDAQLEKVVDTFLVFEPTSAEAVAIAIDGTDAVAETLRARIQALGVTNMRVIKKIERWARQLEGMLAGFEPALLEQAVATVALAGWSFLQPDDAPSIEFLKAYNSVTGLFGRKEEPLHERSWRTMLANYGYGATDELDREILDGVAVGYFREPAVRKAAAEVQARWKRDRRDNSFSRAWDLYHRDLTVDDEAVLDAMHAGAIENLGDITPVNMNAAVRFLRRYGRDEQASELVRLYIEANREKPEFFSCSNQFFFNDPVDPELLAALDAGRAEIVDARDPAEMLKAMAKSNGFNPEEDTARLSRLSSAELVAMFDANAGGDLKGMMEWADRLANQPGADVLRANLSAAIAEIASRSRMREDRLRGWGLLPEEDGGAPKE